MECGGADERQRPRVFFCSECMRQVVMYVFACGREEKRKKAGKRERGREGGEVLAQRISGIACGEKRACVRALLAVANRITHTERERKGDAETLFSTTRQT